MKQTITFVLAFFLFFNILTALVLSQGAAIGINNYHITLTSSITKGVSTAGLGVFNPSDYDENVSVYLECDNCVSDFEIFGLKIGEVIEDPYQYVTLSDRELFLDAHTGPTSPTVVWVSLHPKLFVMKSLRVSTPESVNFFVRLMNKDYSGQFEIPYPSLVVGEKDFHGRISVDVMSSTFGYMGVRPSVAATLEVKVIGMPLGSLVLIIIAIIIVVFLILRRTFKFKITKILRIKRLRKR